MKPSLCLEITGDSLESSLAAARGGAHRIELCSNLVEGGVTPSAGLISVARSRLAIALYVMIRPRGGDFCYTDNEFEIMEQDVAAAKRLGADGIVFGILQTDGNVDVPRSRHLVQIARPLKSTFHRAIDMSSDLGRALEDIIETGADRILTSGGGPNAEQGIPAIAKLVGAAEGRISVMAGGGITESNVARLISETGVREVHASLRTRVPSPMQYRNEKVSMGPLAGREYDRQVILQESVERLLQASSVALK